MPPANAFLTKGKLDKTEPIFPLDVYFCRGCGSVQLMDVVSPKTLFKNYTYLTSASQPLVEHFVELGNEVVKKFLRSPNDLVVEIGSNDGSLLGSIKDNCRILGIEPDKAIADIAARAGVKTLPEFFTSALANKVVTDFGSARVVLANNVIAHIDNLKDVFEGVSALLTDDGAFIFEVHWVGNLIGEGGFDQIYHEHLSYFSLSALRKAADLWGMKLVDVRKVPIHGESLRVYLKKKGVESKAVRRLLEEEKERGLFAESTYRAFAERVRQNKSDLVSMLKKLKKQNKTIVGYGAPAKGNTLLNYCSIDGGLVDYIIDTTPFKQGLYTPGTRIPVLRPEIIKKNPPDYLLLLAWNYADKIMEKEKWYKELGGKFIVPVPSPVIV